MKLKVYDIKAQEKGVVELPLQFNESLRSDLIKRAATHVQSLQIQPHGAKSDAGLRASAEISRRRHNYKGSYGYGISRVPRKIMSHRGNRFSWVGAVAPGTVGGRRAHPPKSEKVLIKNINKKELKKAMRVAISATTMSDVVKMRGHNLSPNYPLVLSDDFESITKTSLLFGALKQLGFEDELKRVESRVVRAGKGKLRGRKYKVKKGPLIVVSNECPLLKVSNLSGVDIVPVSDLNALHLAPGKDPIRLTLFTEGAIKKIDGDKLYI